jgi:hypothetical protein
MHDAAAQSGACMTLCALPARMLAAHAAGVQWLQRAAVRAPPVLG